MSIPFIMFMRYIHRFGVFRGPAAFLKGRRGGAGEMAIRLKDVSKPLHLRRSGSDIKTFDQVFLNREYEFAIGITPSFIIDCGANIGLASVYFKEKFPAAHIVAVEPESSNYQMLLKNTSQYQNIDCIQAGLWNRNAILSVEDSRRFGNWGFVCTEVEHETPHTVRAVSIAEIMNRYGKTEIDLLKIDIEGAELEVFSSDYESWLPKTKVIMIELHDWVRKGCSHSFFTALMHYDFSVYSSGENLVCIRN